MKLIFVLVDALKSKYLTKEAMPFLFELSHFSCHIKQVIQSPGFCERSEIFTGLDSYESGNFTAIGYNPEYSPYKNVGIGLLTARAISVVSETRARDFLYKYYMKHQLGMRPYLIPFNSLKKFSLTEDGSPPLTCYETIFDSLHNKNKSYTLDYFTTLAALPTPKTEDELSFVKRNIDKRIDFIPVYYGEIDAIGHKFGEDIDSIRPYLQKVDRLLCKLYGLALKNNYAFAVLGDHGMIPVCTTVDITSILRKLHYKHYSDYELFIDSTIARFWFYNPRAKEEIRKQLEEELDKYGLIVDGNNYKQYGIPLDITVGKKSVYGDLLWFANPGTLIYPDYFNVKKYKGMHGYLNTNHEHSFGQFIVANSNLDKQLIESESLHKVCNYLCEVLDIDIPNEKWTRTINKDR